MRRLVLLLAAITGLFATPAGASAYTRSDARVPMSDGVELAATLYTPGRPASPGGHGAVILLHGLGGTRGSVDALARRLAEAHVVVTYDARGHGASGGLSSLAGPREIADLRALVGWAAARPGVRAGAVAAFGVSYGGGQVLRALADGVPLAAAAVAATWTDLYSALVPQGLAKSGAMLAFLGSVAARSSPELLALAPDALASRNLDALRSFAASRSALPGLGGVRTPVLLLQGRRDFAFDLAQGIAGFRALAGPKRLYIGNFGHAPSSFPGPDAAHVARAVSEWFARYLAQPGGSTATGRPVEMAPDPWRGRTAGFDALPPTRTFTVGAGGRTRVRGLGSATRRLGRTGTLVETFGAPVVRVRASGSFPHVVAVLTARTPDGRRLVVSQGGAKVRLSRAPRDVAIRLASQATTIPRGSQLALRIGATSGDALYVAAPPRGSWLDVGRVRVTVPVLRRPVSRP